MPDVPQNFAPATAAEALLVRLKQRGVDYLFSVAGTDFAPIIETYARNADRRLAMPEPITTPHESVTVGMAHGYYLASGRPQAAMVHVNVGLANALMGLINAASDNVPIIMMAGRTPHTEGGMLGARSLPIHWGQDMRGQSAMVRELVKWDYELKYAEQAADLVDRAHSVAMSAPRGPVYIGLPREPLGSAWPQDVPFPPAHCAPSSKLMPDPDIVAAISALLLKAERPLIIAQRGDPAGRLAGAVADFCERFAIPLVEFWPPSNVLATSHAMHLGYDPASVLEEADVVVVLDAMVPWIESAFKPGADAKVIQIGPDPLFLRVPTRGFRSDINLTAHPAEAIVALAKVMDAGSADHARKVEARRKAISARSATRRVDASTEAEAGGGEPMSAAFVSKCLSDHLPADARIFSELGCDPSFMSFAEGNRFHSHALAGGLGWGLPAALGACLAEPERVSVATVGDGSYMFANPVACHQLAEAYGLPILTVVFNNGVWNAVRRTTQMMYPDGEAVRMNTMPISSLEPSPDFSMIAAASRAWSARVDKGADLPDAIGEALSAVQGERRQALLEVRVAPTT